MSPPVGSSWCDPPCLTPKSVCGEVSLKASLKDDKS